MVNKVNFLSNYNIREHITMSDVMLKNNLQLYRMENKSNFLKYIEECKIVKGSIVLNENSGIINIANKYYIMPQMTLEEIMNSNLYNILVENYETQKSSFLITKFKHLYLKTIFTGEYFIAITLELENNKLSKVYINTANPEYPHQNEDWINKIHHFNENWCNENLRGFLNKFLKVFIEKNGVVFNDDNESISYNKGLIEYLVRENGYNNKKNYSLKISYLDYRL